jgi:hypothetical protein
MLEYLPALQIPACIMYILVDELEFGLYISRAIERPFKRTRDATSRASYLED